VKKPPIKRRANTLEPEEQENVRGALRALYYRYGSWKAVEDGMGIGKNQLKTVMGKSRELSAGMAIRAAKLAGVPVEDVLSGALKAPAKCPTCAGTRSGRSSPTGLRAGSPKWLACRWTTC